MNLSNTTTLLAEGTPLGNFRGLGPFMPDEITSDTTSGASGAAFESLASTVLTFLTTLAGIAFLLYFVLGALKWITSGGEPQKVESARNQMVSAGIGLVAVIAAYTIAGIASLILGIDILNPAAMFSTLAP